jgi:enediyne biosynthesis protein E4
MSNEPEESGELAHSDDAIIGRAVRWSVVAVVILAGICAGAYFALKPKPAKPPTHVTALVAPKLAVAPTAEIPEARFTDITAASGITFTHVNGAYGEKLLPETMGSGVAFLDYDGDGNQDLLFINSTYWPGHVPEGKTPPTMALYHNDGHGHFTDVTAGSGLDVSLYAMGVAVGDYDNDGLPDVFISCVGGNHLFHNEGGGKFKDVTAEASVGGSGQDWSTSCAWVDYDNDGKLDLFVCNYVRWSREIDLEVGSKLVGVGRAYGQPLNFEGAFCRLYHNEGGGRFKDVSAQAGIQVKNPVTGVPAGKSLGVIPVDLDGDGRIDLVVANDSVQNFVFHNEGDGTFKEIGAMCGIGFDSYGRARGAMGIDAAHFRNDDALGILVGNFATEMTALYVSQGKPLDFADETITEGIGPAGWRLLKFGVFYFDYDLDGRLDVLTADGHLEEEIGKIQQGQQYRQPAQLFWNAGERSGGCFVPVPPEKCGADLFQPIVGRGSAFADIDGDGDLDVVLTQVGGPPLLLRNDQELHHHWIRLKLAGTKSNRDAIGAWIKVRVNGQTLWRQVMPTRGYLSQSELPVTIGLGAAARPDGVEIIWPSGTRQKVQTVEVDHMMTIQEAPPGE